MAADGLVEIAADLDALAERLGEAAIEVLREALADLEGTSSLRTEAAGGSPNGHEELIARAKRTEKLVNRARAAAEKAAHLARQAAGHAAGGDD